MKIERRGFLTRMFGGLAAALGMGGATRWKPVRMESITYEHEDVVISGILGHPLELRLKAMIARDRAQGLEVNYFHTNHATMMKLLSELSFVPAEIGGYQAIVFEGVRWWEVEAMEDDELLLTDVGIRPDCERCNDTGMVVVEVDHAKGVITLAEGTGLPVPYGALFKSVACPDCTTAPCVKCCGVGGRFVPRDPNFYGALGSDANLPPNPCGTGMRIATAFDGPWVECSYCAGVGRVNKVEPGPWSKIPEGRDSKDWYLSFDTKVILP